MIASTWKRRSLGLCFLYVSMTWTMSTPQHQMLCFEKGEGLMGWLVTIYIPVALSKYCLPILGMQLHRKWEFKIEKDNEIQGITVRSLWSSKKNCGWQLLRNNCGQSSQEGCYRRGWLRKGKKEEGAGHWMTWSGLNTGRCNESWEM